MTRGSSRARHLATVAIAVSLGCGDGGDGQDIPELPRPAAPVADATDPRLDVIDRIEQWNADLSEEDRDAKYCKMAISPFRFFRGANHLFWRIAPGHPRLAPLSSGATLTWVQGDLHAQNIGAFDNDDGDVIYDLNDFDEAVIADYQLDLWRMATSMVLIAAENGNLSESETDAFIEALVTGYASAMAAYALDDSETQRTFDAGELPEPLRSFVLDVASNNDRLEALDDWTTIDGGVRELDVSLDDLEAVSMAEATAIADAVPGYGLTLTGGIDFDPSYFAIKSVARRRFAGTGSLGVSRYYMLIEGPSSDNDDDRILDIKKQSAPTALFFDVTIESRYDGLFSNHAARHAIANKALADDVDDHLGVMELPDGSYSVRERSVFKKSFDTTSIVPGDALAVAGAWGEIVATAHARSDNDFNSQLIATSADESIAAITAGRVNELAATILALAREQADQTQLDWARFIDELAPSTCP